MNFLRSCLRDTNNSTNTPTSNRSDRLHGDGIGMALSSPSSSSSAYIRRAHHAGSWYTSNPIELDNLLTKLLADATLDSGSSSSGQQQGSGVPNACISPHAGFRYSGPTAAYSYIALGEALRKNPSLKTVVVVSYCFAEPGFCFVVWPSQIHCLSFLFIYCSSIHRIICISTVVQCQVSATYAMQRLGT